MRYNKHIHEGYITAVGTGGGGTEITREEHDAILVFAGTRPTPPEGYGYRLRADLTWELFELPPVEEPTETEPTIDEMMAAITEGVNAI